MNPFTKAFYKVAQKAATNANRLYQSTLFTLGQGMPIAFDDDKETYIEQGFNYNSVMYSAVSYITQKGAGLKYKVVEVNELGEEQEADSEAADALRNLLKAPNQKYILQLLQ